MKAEYIDHMGTDLSIVNAARVSFAKESEWELKEIGGLKNHPDVYGLCEKDERLISYLARHNHWTPFSHCMITLRESVPIFVARQRFKHTVGFTYNEKSRRYVDDVPSFHIPEVWRRRAENKKQGSGEDHPDQTEAHERYGKLWRYALDEYVWMINHGFAPEQARMILPQSMLTSYYVTGSLAAWARAYKLRIAEDSQKEIQCLAKQWGTILEPLFPVSWRALT